MSGGKQELSCFFISEDGGRCFCSSHKLSLRCWLSSGWGTRQACTCSTFLWRLPRLLWFLGGSVFNSEMESTSFSRRTPASPRLKAVRTDKPSSLCWRVPACPCSLPHGIHLLCPNVWPAAVTHQHQTKANNLTENVHLDLPIIDDACCVCVYVSYVYMQTYIHIY